MSKIDTEIEKAKPAAPAVNADYDERIAPARAAARQKIITGFVADAKASEAALLGSVRLGIKGVNKLRDAGLKWIAAGDKNQFDMYFYDLAETLVAQQDRKYVTRGIVKTAMHLANILHEPVENAAEAAPFIQKCLYAFGLDTPGHREVEEEHHTKNIFSSMVMQAKKAVGYLRAVEDQDPLPDWDSQRLDTFIREWQPIAAKHKEAVQIRLKLPEQTS
jgi:hypothetical protein